jgi:hypothetical protein
MTSILVDPDTRRFAARRSDIAGNVSEIAVPALTRQVAYRPCVPAATRHVTTGTGSVNSF